MTPLLLTAATQLLAPALDAALRTRARIRAFGDGLVQVTVAGLLLVHVVPAGLAEGGWPALVALAAGLGAGLLAHRLPNGERSIFGLALLGLVLHGAADGVALATADRTQGSLIAAAVVLHTLPVALATWRLARARGGTPLGAAALGVTIAATFGGYTAAEPLVRSLPAGALGVAECAVAGALLHVVGHLGGPRTPATGWGGLLGVGVVVLLGVAHGAEAHHHDALLAPALHLALTAAPALALGYAAAAAVRPGRAGAVVALAASVALLGPVLAVLRAGATLGGAWLAGRPGEREWIRRPAWSALHEAVDRTAAQLLVGLGLAALVPAFLVEIVLGLPPPVAVAVAVAVGLARPLCPLAITPVAAALIGAGASVGTALALVVAGPILGPDPTRRSLLAAVATATAAGLAADLLPAGLHTFAVRALDGPHGPTEIGAAIALCALFAGSLVRRGPTGLFEPVVHPIAAHHAPNAEPRVHSP